MTNHPLSLSRLLLNLTVIILGLTCFSLCDSSTHVLAASLDFTPSGNVVAPVNGSVNFAITVRPVSGEVIDKLNFAIRYDGTELVRTNGTSSTFNLGTSR